MPGETIGLIAHAGKHGARELLARISEAFHAHGVPVAMDDASARLAGDRDGVGDIAAVSRLSRLIVVLGGDGTMLRVVHGMRDSIKPLFGINLGSLGFLTGVGSTDYQLAVESIVRGDLALSQRTMLGVSVRRAGTEVASHTGLNDAVLSRGELSRLVRLEVHIDGENLTSYHADGLIVSTPTGSTAYSLSAGGPILLPESNSLVITPICPHVLTNRSVIVANTSRIEVSPCEGQKDVFLTIDGQEVIKIRTGDIVAIERSSHSLPLATLPGRSFSNLLRLKLRWSGSNL